jgi:uncharacterized protein (DUF885 family)
VTLDEGLVESGDLTDSPTGSGLRPADVPSPTTEADLRLLELVRTRFDSLVERFPVFGTFLGLSQHDGRLSDGSRDAIDAEIGAAREFETALEALDVTALSPYFRIERELALFTTRRGIFDDDVHRVWERRVNATDEIGDGIFLVLARGTRPLPERLDAIASRLEAAPNYIEQQKTRLNSKPPVRLWNEMELDAITSMPSLFDDVLATAKGEYGEGNAEVGRLETAASATTQALDAYAGWLRDRLANASEDMALGAERYEELIGLRAFDGLDGDHILAIGEEQLAYNRDQRRRVAAEIDAGASELEVLDRVKSDHPASFGAALDGYRSAMNESRQYILEHDIASLPDGESISVVETPEYLRNVMPFAAYFNPPKFASGSAPKGLYVVTPSVDGDPRAMREHNFASIYNTSIHEAYPGHHHQLAAANTHPSLVRLQVDAPEFVEGWAMYCEQMMREEGFDTAPSHMLMMYTDAIWRACRIILDVKLHRGEINLADAIEIMIDNTGFERAQATAEVNRYTYTPTYQLSYLLGKVLLLRLRDDEKRRLGNRFSLRGFHDALLREGSLPISFHRRLLAASAS